MKMLFLALLVATAMTATAHADLKTNLTCVDNEKTYAIEIYELYRNSTIWTKKTQFALVTEQGRNTVTTYLNQEFYFYNEKPEYDSTNFVIRSKHTKLNCKKVGQTLFL